MLLERMVLNPGLSLFDLSPAGQSIKLSVLPRRRVRTRASSERNLLTEYPDVAAEWHPEKNTPITPYQVVAGGLTKFWWICKHGHEWQTTIGHRVNLGTDCPECTNQTSRIEIAIYAELCALFKKVAWRERIGSYECDIYKTEYKIAIEVDGMVWHKRRPEQELKKSAAFEDEGILLFRVRGD